HRARRQAGEVVVAEKAALVAEREPDRVAVDEHVGGVRVALGQREHRPEPLAEHRLGDGARVVPGHRSPRIAATTARPPATRKRAATPSTRPSASKQDSTKIPTSARPPLLTQITRSR